MIEFDVCVCVSEERATCTAGPEEIIASLVAQVSDSLTKKVGRSSLGKNSKSYRFSMI